MKKRRYPLSLFIIGFITNMLFRFFWLFIPCVIFLVIGIFAKSCLNIGVSLLVLDIILSFIEQLRIRHAMIADSDNPEFSQFQDALSKEGNWMKNVQEYMDEKTESSSGKEV